MSGLRRHAVEANHAVLAEDLGTLISRTHAFGDPVLQGGSRCILAVASCSSLTSMRSYEELAAALQAAPKQVARALVQIIHCQEATLANRPQFFKLFDLAETLEVSVCQQVCKQAVADNIYQSPPIRLRSSVEQATSVRKLLRESFHSSLLTDAQIRVRRTSIEDGDDKDSWDTIRVHAVVLAASCEYLRGLWLAAFQENSTAEMSADVNDPRDLGAVKALVEVVYGGVAEVAATEDLVRMFVLADRLQCAVARDAALYQLDSSLAADDALELLGRSTPLPDGLYQAAVNVLVTQLSSSSGMDLHEMPGLTWTAVSRLLNSAPLEEDHFIDTLRHYVLGQISSRTLSTKDLLQLNAKAFGPLLALLSQPVGANVECTGETASVIQVDHLRDKIVVSRFDYANNESSKIKVFGPACITFTKFQTEHRYDRLCFGLEEYSGHDKPPPRKVARGSELIMEWATDASNTDEGWSFEVTGLEDPLPSSCLIPMVEWCKSGQAEPEHAEVCQAMRELHAAACDQNRRSAATADCNQRLDALFKDAYCYLLQEFGVAMLVVVLRVAHAAGRPRSHDVATDSACEWAVLSMEEVVQSSEWLQIEPDSMLTLVEFATAQALHTSWEPFLPAQLYRWAREGQGMDAAEAVRWVGMLEGPGAAGFMQKAACHFLASSHQDSVDTVCRLLDESLCASRSPSKGDIETQGSCLEEGNKLPRAHSSSEGRRWWSAEKDSAAACSVAHPPEEGKLLDKIALLREGAMLWCGQMAVEGRFALLGQSPGWLELRPAALVHAVCGALEALRQEEDTEDGTRRDTVAQAVGSWVDAASVAAIFDAIAEAGAHGNSEEAFRLVQEAAERRCSAIEAQNGILEGNHFHHEVERAVDAVRMEVEACFLAERQEMRRQHLEAVAAQQRETEVMRTRFLGALDTLRDELGGAVSTHSDQVL